MSSEMTHRQYCGNGHNIDAMSIEWSDVFTIMHEHFCWQKVVITSQVTVILCRWAARNIWEKNAKLALYIHSHGAMNIFVFINISYFLTRYSITQYLWSMLIVFFPFVITPAMTHEAFLRNFFQEICLTWHIKMNNSFSSSRWSLKWMGIMLLFIKHGT